MKVDITVPAMGESIAQAVISTILAPSGSLVAQDQDILELETDKVNQVLHAPQAGQITLTVAVGDTVKIGQVIGSIDTGIAVPKQPEKKEVAPTPEPGSARKMAPEFVASLREPAPSSPAAPVNGQKRKKLSSLRRTIAARLVEVKNNTAMLTTFNEVDMSRIIEIRAKEKERGVKIGFMPFFIQASASALKAFPEVNAYLEGDEIVYFDSYDIGIAVSTDRGLMVPVIKRCDTLSSSEIETELTAFAEKARAGTISIDDLRGGSFTITNGGVFGSLLSTPILNPPQSGILGMHTIVKRPVVVNDQIVIRPMMYLALSYDHRIVDGKEAIQFLLHIKERLENP